MWPSKKIVRLLFGHLLEKLGLLFTSISGRTDYGFRCGLHPVLKEFLCTSKLGHLRHRFLLRDGGYRLALDVIISGLGLASDRLLQVDEFGGVDGDHDAEEYKEHEGGHLVAEVVNKDARKGWSGEAAEVKRG